MKTSYLEGPLRSRVGQLGIADKPHTVRYEGDMTKSQAYVVYAKAVDNWHSVYATAVKSPDRAKIENFDTDTVISFKDGSELVFAC